MLDSSKQNIERVKSIADKTVYNSDFYTDFHNKKVGLNNRYRKLWRGVILQAVRDLKVEKWYEDARDFLLNKNGQLELICDTLHMDMELIVSYMKARTKEEHKAISLTSCKHLERWECD